MTWRIFAFIGFLASGASIASMTYAGWHIIGSFSVKIGDEIIPSPDMVMLNSSWYMTISLIIFDLVSLGCFVYAFALIISPAKGGYIEHALGRIIAYIVNGFAVFGVSANMGIAAGSLCWFAGFLDIIGLFLNKMGCLVPWTEAQRIQNEEEEREAKALEKKMKEEEKKKEKEEKQREKEERKREKEAEKARQKEEKEAAKARQKEEKEAEKARQAMTDVIEENPFELPNDGDLPAQVVL